VSIIDRLIKKLTGFDPSSVKTEKDRRAYKWIHRFTWIMLCVYIFFVPVAVYIFFTVYLPVLSR